MKVFFKEKGETEINEISRHLKFEYFNSNDKVFEYGSIGDKFYLILKGSVSVMLPSKNQKEAMTTFIQRQESLLNEKKGSPIRS